MKKVVLFFLLFVVFASPTLWAQQAVNNVWEAANSEHYGTKFGGMLGRGLLNIATSFVDVIVHTVEGTKQGPPFVGTLTGLGSGIGCTALRVTSGALDVVTFWVPGFNGFPVSRSYKNCLEFEEEELGPAGQDYAAPVAGSAAEDYAKPAAPAQRDAMEYVKK
ncbi:MAG: hypothetical protein HY447_01670 [Candidatus Omnitrophica bacterium]|nr:hypothetical protein [Candidatus Omnitrophota bacterium]